MKKTVRTTDTGKARITITLRNSLLPQLDRFIDGDQIRNRSHAIEYMLSQHLGLGIEQAVIFCGANEQHEIIALTQIQHRPMIAYWFEMLKNVGIRNVILVIDQYGDDLKTVIGNGQQWGLHVTYVRDAAATGTAHALSLVKPLIERTFILLYSDMLADINLTDMAEYHRGAGTTGTMALTYKRNTDLYGVARMEGMKIVEFEEKLGDAGQHGLINAGVYFFEPAIFDMITSDVHSLETDVLPQLARAGQLAGYPFQSRWFDLSLASGRAKAETDWIV